MHLALNNLQWLIYHKTKPNQPLSVENCKRIKEGRKERDGDTI